MNKIVKIHVNDLLSDSQNASEMLSKACRHQHPMRVVGCCKTGDVLVFSLEPVVSNENKTYVFAPFPSSDQDDIVAEISSRYYAGFSTITGFLIDDNFWGLFCLDRNLK